MSDNGKVKDVLKVELSDGGMKVSFGTVNQALISHAFIQAFTMWQNELMKSEAKKESPIQIPKGLIDKLRR